MIRRSGTEGRAAALLGALVLLFFSPSCRKEAVLDDLGEEIDFARSVPPRSVDFMGKKAEILLGRGWSRGGDLGARVGLDPGSRLFFSTWEDTPLYLHLSCRPLSGEKGAARSLRVVLNRKELAGFELKGKTTRSLRVHFPREFLKRGENILDLLYIPGGDFLEKLDTAGERRPAVHYSALFLSPEPVFQKAKAALDARERLEREYPGSFVQDIPSTLDFYLRLPAAASIEAKFERISASASGGGGREKEPFLEVSVHSEEGKTVLFRRFLTGEEHGEESFRSGIPVPGAVRLRFQALSGEDEGSPGFLVWKKAVISSGRPRGGRDRAGEEKVEKLGRFLAGKNIVIVILDAGRADRFSAYGHTRPTTPNIDRFAEGGTLFANAFCESLTTRTSVGTLFTGLPLSVHGMDDITSRIPDGVPTIAEALREKGFRTAGFTGVGNIGSAFGFDRGFEQYYELYKEKGFHRKSQEYLPYLLPWLEANRDRRFFLYVHFKEPHSVYLPLPPFRGMFSSGFKETVDLETFRLRDSAADLSDEQVAYIRACYDETLASADWAVGRMLEAMERMGLLERSIVILTADHGEFLGEHSRVFGHGGYFGESGIHIPLIMRLPKAGFMEFPRRVESLVKTSDLFATLAHIHDLKVPGELLQGRSLLPLLARPGLEINPHVIIEKTGTPGTCLRSPRFKLILWEDHVPEFYDLLADPEERTNLHQETGIEENRLMVEIRKWKTRQALLRKVLVGAAPGKNRVDYEKLDRETLENLRALGYIK